MSRSTTMRLSIISKAVRILPSALLVFGLQTKSNKGPTIAVAVVSVDAPAQELLLGYAEWGQRHPDAIPQRSLLPPPAQGRLPNQPAEASGVATNVNVLGMPSVDLYSPSGVLLYHGADSEKNAAFIRALPRSIQQAKTDQVRPTLKEAMEMLHDLKPYEAALLAKKEYTVFALTFPGFIESEAQDDAIQQLKRRARRTGIRVIEVRLHK